MACSFAGQGGRNGEHSGTLILANSKSDFSTVFFLDCLLPMEAMLHTSAGVATTPATAATPDHEKSVLMAASSDRPQRALFCKSFQLVQSTRWREAARS